MSFELEIKKSLQQPDAGPVFVAGLNRANIGQNMCLTVHFFKGAATTEQIDFITRELLAIDASLSFEVQEHDASAILEARSLEEFSSVFDHDTVLLDPTGAIQRIGGLVQFNEQLKRNFFNEVADVCWDHGERQVAVLVRSPEHLSNAQLDLALSDAKHLLLNSGWSHVDCQLTLAQNGNEPNLVRVGARSDRTTLKWTKRRSERPAMNFKAIRSFLGAMSLVGFGAAATAKEPYDPPHQEVPPAVCAIQDMTNLGLDALGNYNDYRAKCAIKLYLGDLADLVSPIDSALLSYQEPDAAEAIFVEVVDRGGSSNWLPRLRFPLFQDYGV